MAQRLVSLSLTQFASTTVVLQVSYQSLAVDCLLFGLSAASNNSDSIECPHSPPNVRKQPDKTPSGSFVCSPPSISNQAYCCNGADAAHGG